MAGTERLIDFPVKITPITVDTLYAADSQAAGNEVQVTINQVVQTSTIPLKVANNLDDVADVAASRNNLSVPSATGSGASGTWGINVSGNAATATTAASATTCVTVPALTGDITTSGTTNATTLKSTGTAGTYPKVTTDAQGRVSSGTTLSAGDIPNIAESQVTNLTADLAARLIAANNLSDVPTPATAQNNLNIPSRSGAGATGTWGINISGNAATATSASSVTSVTSSQISDSTAAGRTLLTAASNTAQRTALALGTMATQPAGGVAITGGSIQTTNISEIVAFTAGSTRTLFPTDAGSTLTFTNTGTVTVTIDSDANQPITVGSRIALNCQGGSAALVSVVVSAAFTAAGGTFWNNIVPTVPNGGEIGLKKINANVWVMEYLYNTGIFSTTWGGAYGSSVSGDIPYMRIGRQVTLQIPSITGTSVASSYIGVNTALPNYLIPLVTQNGYFSVINSGANVDGKFTCFSSTGGLRFYVGQFANFTSSGTAGLNAGSITYIL